MRPAGGSAPSFPMLIKCSEAGQVLWMSQRRAPRSAKPEVSRTPLFRPRENRWGNPPDTPVAFVFLLSPGAADGLLLSAHLLGEEEELREESGPRARRR